MDNPKAKAEFIKFANAPENRIIDSMEEAGRIAQKYAPEGVEVLEGYKSRTGFMDSGLRDLITKPVEFSNPFEGRGERPDETTAESQKKRKKRLSRTAPGKFAGTENFQFPSHDREVEILFMLASITLISLVSKGISPPIFMI